MDELLDNICKKCSSEQRYACRNSERGCDEFYVWRRNHIDKIFKGMEMLEEKEKNNENK